MKKNIILFFIMFATLLRAQTSIEVVKVDTDSTVLYQFKESTKKDGKEVGFRLFPESPLPKKEFGMYVLDLTLPMHQSIQDANVAIQRASSTISALGGVVDSLLGPGTYNSLYSAKVLSQLDGSWTLLTSTDDKILDAVSVAIKDGKMTRGAVSSDLSLSDSGMQIGKGVLPEPVLFKFQDGAIVGALGDKVFTLKQ